ncbi:hypothetical protein ACFW04_012783 [Cataglyphis niger]
MRTANLAVACIRAIRDTGLEVASQKSEAPFFPRVTVDDTSIQVAIYLKYLGLYLDAVAHSLNRFLPNLGGPADTLVASKRRLTLLRRIHKRVAIRMIRGYRTVSHTAAILLAKVAAHRTHRCMPKYTGVRRVRRGLDSVRAAVRLQARRRMLKRWDEDLSKPRDNSGKRVVEAIRSRLMKWTERMARCHTKRRKYSRATDVSGPFCATSVAKRMHAATTVVRMRTTYSGVLSGADGRAPCSRPKYWRR